MVANSGKLSTMSTTASNTLTDKVDSPHSGLFQALHVMAQGNYALKDHASTLGFAHTFAGGSSPTVAVTAGKVFSDGEYIAVDALTATALTKPSTGAFYHWVVASNDGDGTGTLSIVSGSTDGVVPDLNTTSVTVEKVPISLIKVQSTDTDSTIGFQYFTTSKEQNSLSLGYSATNVYTEMSKITAASGGTTVEVGTAGGDFIIDNTDADKKIVMRLGSDDANTDFEIRNNSDDVKFGIDGLGATTITGTLHVVDSGTSDTIRLESTDDGTALAPDLVFKRTTATPANGDLIGNIKFLSMNSNTDDGSGTEAEHEFADIYARVNDITTGSESGELYLRTYNAGTNIKRMDLSLLEAVFNEDGLDINFRVESDDETHMLFLDANNNRISIGDSVDAPAGTLEITNHATTGATGVPLLQLNNNDTDQIALDIDAANIDANVIDITANALTTGSALNIASTSSSTGTRNLAYIHNNHASAVNTTALKVESIATDGSTDTSTAPTLHVKTASAGEAVTIESTAATADDAPEITLLSSAGSGGSGVGATNDDIGRINFKGPDDASATAAHHYAEIFADAQSAANGSERGRLLIRTFSGSTGINNLQCETDETIINGSSQDVNFRVVTDDENFFFFVDGANNRAQLGNGDGTPAATLEITNHATAGATGVPLLQLNSNDTDEVAVDINAANVDADVMIITADAVTTAQVLDVSADALTTGSILLLHSDSSDTSSRELVHIHNDNTSATGTTALHVHNDSTGPVAKFTGSSALLAKVGLPETVAASAGSNITTYAGISGRATTVVLAASTTYTATTSDSGVVIVLTTTTSKVVLPDIPTTGTIGVQFTIINAGGGTISDGITTGDASNCKVNGSVPSSGQVSIADNETFTFIQFAADEWHKIG